MAEDLTGGTLDINIAKDSPVRVRADVASTFVDQAAGGFLQAAGKIVAGTGELITDQRIKDFTKKQSSIHAGMQGVGQAKFKSMKLTAAANQREFISANPDLAKDATNISKDLFGFSPTAAVLEGQRATETFNLQTSLQKDATSLQLGSQILPEGTAEEQLAAGKDAQSTATQIDISNRDMNHDINTILHKNAQLKNSGEQTPEEKASSLRKIEDVYISAAVQSGDPEAKRMIESGDMAGAAEVGRRKLRVANNGSRAKATADAYALTLRSKEASIKEKEIAGREGVRTASANNLAIIREFTTTIGQSDRLIVESGGAGTVGQTDPLINSLENYRQQAAGMIRKSHNVFTVHAASASTTAMAADLKALDAAVDTQITLLKTPVENLKRDLEVIKNTSGLETWQSQSLYANLIKHFGPRAVSRTVEAVVIGKPALSALLQSDIVDKLNGVQGEAAFSAFNAFLTAVDPSFKNMTPEQLKGNVQASTEMLDTYLGDGEGPLLDNGDKVTYTNTIYAAQAAGLRSTDTRDKDSVLQRALHPNMQTLLYSTAEGEPKNDEAVKMVADRFKAIAVEVATQTGLSEAATSKLLYDPRAMEYVVNESALPKQEGNKSKQAAEDFMSTPTQGNFTTKEGLRSIEQSRAEQLAHRMNNALKTIVKYKDFESGFEKTSSSQTASLFAASLGYKTVTGQTYNLPENPPKFEHQVAAASIESSEKNTADLIQTTKDKVDRASLVLGSDGKFKPAAPKEGGRTFESLSTEELQAYINDGLGTPSGSPSFIKRVREELGRRK
tara:strand:- start:616 stop:2979 length:2364 start_codon:yes stop_codon:yes gene_type:complete